MPSFPVSESLKENNPACQNMSSPHENIQQMSPTQQNGSASGEPDPDTIKMFVGQIPRHHDEDDLKKMFTKYGPVYNVTVLRDKQKGQSKGCCFVTFYKRQHSLDAQNELHNLKTMPGMSHPIQMKPADSEKRNVEERKLFVGMISKKWTENDVRVLFSPFGAIEECTILRENNESKGCAFVTFANKVSAMNAIKSIHHSQTMEGCRSPVVVKIADTQKDKEMRKMQQINSNILTAAQQLPLTALCPQYLTPFRGHVSPYAASSPYSSLTNHPSAANDPHLLQQAIGSGNIGALGALGLNNSLGLQQLMSSANSQSGNNPMCTNSSGSSSDFVSPSATPNPSSVTGEGLYGTGSCDMNNMQNLQHLQSLALLANLANSQASMNPMNLQLLNQLAASNSASTTSSGLSGLNSTASILSKSGLFGDHHHDGGKMPHRLNATGSPIISLSDMMTPTSSSGANMGGSSLNMNAGGLGSLNGFGNGGMSNSSGNPSMEALYTGLQQYAASFPGSVSAAALQQQKMMSGDGAAGPDGANLFIYHLPQEYGDHDLMQTFMPFGNVVSSKVFIDKQTKLSKCFGFVSFDNPLSAHAAIQNMNGFQIGTKRLKVQLKRPKGDGKPY